MVLATVQRDGQERYATKLAVANQEARIQLQLVKSHVIVLLTGFVRRVLVNACKLLLSLESLRNQYCNASQNVI